MIDDAVLGIFAKRPEPGRVKTRLAAETSPEWAAEVADGFLRETLERVRRLAVRRVLAYAPADAGPWFSALTKNRFDLCPQSDGDLGQRMAAFFAAQFAQGAQRVVLIGTDSPSLPLAYIEQALTDLGGADVVLGPAADGGYYLVGCRGRVPPIFAGVRWGTAHVLGETLARLDAAWKVAVLPPWYDVDTLADWHMLQGHRAALARAANQPDALAQPRRRC